MKHEKTIEEIFSIYNQDAERDATEAKLQYQENLEKYIAECLLEHKNKENPFESLQSDNMDGVKMHYLNTFSESKNNRYSLVNELNDKISEAMRVIIEEDITDPEIVKTVLETVETVKDNVNETLNEIEEIQETTNAYTYDSQSFLNEVSNDLSVSNLYSPTLSEQEGVMQLGEDRQSLYDLVEKNKDRSIKDSALYNRIAESIKCKVVEIGKNISKTIHDLTVSIATTPEAHYLKEKLDNVSRTITEKAKNIFGGIKTKFHQVSLNHLQSDNYEIARSIRFELAAATKILASGFGNTTAKIEKITTEIEGKYNKAIEKRAIIYNKMNKTNYSVDELMKQGFMPSFDLLKYSLHNNSLESIDTVDKTLKCKSEIKKCNMVIGFANIVKDSNTVRLNKQESLQAKFKEEFSSIVNTLKQDGLSDEYVAKLEERLGVIKERIAINENKIEKISKKISNMSKKIEDQKEKKSAMVKDLHNLNEEYQTYVDTMEAEKLDFLQKNGFDKKSESIFENGKTNNKKDKDEDKSFNAEAEVNAIEEIDKDDETGVEFA